MNPDGPRLSLLESFKLPIQSLQLVIDEFSFYFLSQFCSFVFLDICPFYPGHLICRHYFKLFSELSFLKKILSIYFLKRRREGERVRNLNVHLLLTCPLLGTWPTTQTCVLETGNLTGDPLVHRPALHPLSHTSWEYFQGFLSKAYY